MPRVLSFAAFTLLCLSIAIGCGKKDDSDSGGGGGGQPVMLSRTADDKKVAVNQLRQIGLALHNSHDAYQTLPAGIVGPKGQLGLSWRVAILPYIEEGNLFKEFKLEEPWDSEHNKKLITKMPKVFEAPGTVIGNGKTFLRSFAGSTALIPVQVALGPKGPTGINAWANQPPGSFARGRRLTDITDGTSNTLMVVEAADPVEWTKPDDLPFPDLPGMPGASRTPLPKLGGLFDGGFHGLMCDGAVHFFPNKLTDQDLRRLISVNDGEINSPEVNAILFPRRGNGKEPDDREEDAAKPPSKPPPASKAGTKKTYDAPK